jgi:hypothetical protein
MKEFLCKDYVGFIHHHIFTQWKLIVVTIMISFPVMACGSHRTLFSCQHYSDPAWSQSLYYTIHSGGQPQLNEGGMKWQQWNYVEYLIFQCLQTNHKLILSLASLEWILTFWHFFIYCAWGHDRGPMQSQVKKELLQKFMLKYYQIVQVKSMMIIDKWVEQVVVVFSFIWSKCIRALVLRDAIIRNIPRQSISSPQLDWSCWTQVCEK